MSLPAVDALLAEAVHRGDPPAAQCCVLLDGAPIHDGAHGCDPESVFDLASVTKVAATTSALALLASRRALGLDDHVGRYLSSGAHPDLTLRALLAHRSGLPAWRPFFTRAMADPLARAIYAERPRAPLAAWARARRLVLEGVLAAPLEVPGQRVYSDLGFITLGAVVETVAAERLHTFARRALHPGRDLGFVDLARGRSWLDDRAVVATGVTRPREPAPGQEGRCGVPEARRPEDPGRVDDDNAFAMGGVAGHAGLFGTARALARFAHDAWIDDALGLGDTRRAFLEVDEGARGPPRALGFDVPTPGSSAGRLARGARVVGHLGFTGCSVWMDLDRRLVVALLTNRTLPGRHRVEGIRALRPAVHDAVADALA